MKTSKTISMWTLIANNSVLLKSLLFAAAACFIMSLLPRWHPAMVASIFFSFVALTFASILLVANAARLLDRREIQLIPRIRPTMLLIFFAWSLLFFAYVSLQYWLSVPSHKLSFDDFLETIMVVPTLSVTFLAVMFLFDLRTTPFVFLALFLFIVALGNIDSLGLPAWLDSILYAQRNNVLIAIPIISLLAILKWALGSVNQAKIFTQSINKRLAQMSSINVGVKIKDIKALHINQHNQNYSFLIFCWSLALIALMLVSKQVSEAPILQQAGVLIIAQLTLVFIVPDNSILNMRQLWLKSQGDRSALFIIWKSKKTKQLLAINISLLLINIGIAWWQSFSPKITLLIVSSVFVLSFSGFYARALSIAHYWNPLNASFLVYFANVAMVAKLFVFTDQLNINVLGIIAITLCLLTLLFKTQLQKQFSKIDWLLMPKVTRII